MNQITSKQGNVISALKSNEIDLLFHVCNHTWGMGAGIAKQLADKYPELVIEDIAYRKAYRNNENVKNYPCYYFTKSTKDGDVANIYAMINTGFSTNIENDMLNDRIRRLTLALSAIFQKNSHKKIGCPLVLSGLGRDVHKSTELDDLEYFKEYIEPHLKELVDRYNIDLTIYYLNKFD